MKSSRNYVVYRLKCIINIIVKPYLFNTTFKQIIFEFNKRLIRVIVAFLGELASKK